MEITLTKDNFENEVLKADKPVLVDFWATWCGPCKMLAPVIKEISEEYANEVKVCKVNVDDEEELAEQFQVMSIPMLLVFKNGQVVNKAVGSMPKENVLALLK